ncbi:MAG: hypothetical protein IE909_06735 [Campylobacterales bacterium]|nr:hypothetical protein [Campylobacterales bacterium]
MKVFVAFFIFLVYLEASQQKVVVSSKSINWKGSVTTSNTKVMMANSDYNCKEYIDFKNLDNLNLRAKHYILPNRAICVDDVYTQSNNKIKFSFGSVEIEKDGELIKETDEYIKFRNPNGSIEKIYKDGRGQ